MLKLYANVLCMGGNTWPNQILTWSAEGRKRRERPEIKWEREVKTVIKQNNLNT